VSTADPAIASIVSSTDLTEAQKESALGMKPSKKQARFDPNISDTGFGGIRPAPQLALFGMHKIVVKGESLGETELLAELPDQTPWQKPTRVVVVSNLSSRQVDGGPVRHAFQQELQMLSLGDAAVRVAQDQMNSSFAKASAGDNRYNLPKDLKKADGKPATDWCGAFVYWCYQQASAIKGKQNPLGPINDVMLSPQKAIGWAVANPLRATMLRYKGRALFQWGSPHQLAKQDQLIDVVPGTNLLAGDICLVRNDTDWQHVCLVKDPGDGDALLTIDCNQMEGGSGPSMQMVRRDMNSRIGNGLYKYVFVHLNLP